MRPRRKATGGLPEEHNVARDVFFGSVERGSIRRHVSEGGGGVSADGCTNFYVSLCRTPPYRRPCK